jgi:ABC-type glycerol-3-phosphate transport system permease component
MTVTAEERRVLAPSRTIAWYQRKSTRALIWKIIAFALLTVVAILFFAPVVWMFSSSLKDNLHVLDGKWIPSPAHWDNYKQGWIKNGANFSQYARNTLVVTISSVAGVVISSSMVAYSFARLRWPGRDALFIFVLATMLLPGIVMFIPQYIIWSKLNMTDTYIPLVLPSWFGSAFFIFLLRQFYRGIPEELSDAARVDGASEVRIWWQIIMPLARPALTAVAIFAFTGAWEDFFNPLIYLNTESKFTLQIGLQVFSNNYGGFPQYNLLMAVGLIIMLPVIIFYFIGQRYFIEGVTLTGLKG